MASVRRFSACGAWGVSSRNRFLVLEEVGLFSPGLVSTARSENRVTLSCRSSSTSLSFCSMSAENGKELINPLSCSTTNY